MKVIFGGTFDPVHLGHVNMARQASTQLKANDIHFMPCALPVHKQAPGVTTSHRVAMLKALCENYEGFWLDERELKRTTPSYSLLSMREWRAEYPNEPLVMLIGTDSFNSLPSWYEWEALVELCHIAVYKRPTEQLSQDTRLLTYLQRSQVSDAAELHHKIAGLCMFLEGPLVAISSSEVREQIATGQRYNQVLPECISSYIAKHKLYAETLKTS